MTQLGARFTQEPTTVGPATRAVLDDTVGNLVQIYEVKDGGRARQARQEKPAAVYPE